MDAEKLDKAKLRFLDDYGKDIRQIGYEIVAGIAPGTGSIEARIYYDDDLSDDKKKQIESLIPSSYIYSGENIPVNLAYAPIPNAEGIDDIKIPPEVSNFLGMRDAHASNYDFSQHSIDDVLNLVGQPLIEQMYGFFETDENVIKWFYTPCWGIGKKSPYEYCSENLSEEKLRRLEQIIGLMESGDFGGI